MKTLILDLSGLKCPLPVLRTRKALRGMDAGAQVEIVATDPMSAIDIPNLVRETSDRLIEQKRDGARLTFVIEKAGSEPPRDN
jgi:tRNA 2-thiouridine synthesizing protein A